MSYHMTIQDCHALSIVEAHNQDNDICLRVEGSGATRLLSTGIKSAKGGEHFHITLSGLPKHQRMVLAALFGTAELCAHLSQFGECGPKEREPLSVTPDEETQWDHNPFAPAEDAA